MSSIGLSINANIEDYICILYLLSYLCVVVMLTFLSKKLKSPYKRHMVKCLLFSMVLYMTFIIMTFIIMAVCLALLLVHLNYS
jgi:hypothetical protein